MSARPDLIVVGAGISGLASALWLFESGLKPIVIPAPELPDLLPPLDLSLALPWHRSGVLNQLERRGMVLLPELMTRLAQDTGVDLVLEHRNLLVVSPIVGGEADRQTPEWKALVQGPVASFEPQFSEGYQPVWCLPDRPTVRSDRLARALSLALTRRGVDILGHRSAKRLEVTGNIVRGVELNNREFIAAEATVMASDCACTAILHESGLETIVGGARLAPALQFAPSSAALTCALVEPSMLLAPRADGRLVALSNLGAVESEILTLNELRRRVHSRLPGLGRHDLEQSGRLQVPDSVRQASVGAYPGVRGLWLNMGHAAFGPIMAPAAAEFLSEQLAGGAAVDELEPVFSPSMQPSC